MATEVHHRADQSRYELTIDGEVVAVADYRRMGDAVVMFHTEVDRHRRGRGLGEELVRAALDDVRQGGHTVVPSCWFVAQFVEEHPEYGDLVRA